MRSAGISDVGLVRKLNEDSFVCIDLSKEFGSSSAKSIFLYIVADGMGGANAGEIASSMAISEMLAFIRDNYYILQDSSISDESIQKIIKNAILHTNDRIYKRSLLDNSCYGMGTTLSLVLAIDKAIYTAHIGDSRIYLFRSNSIKQLTEDHSLVAELVKNGTIKPEDANSHPQKNVITRALGTEYSVEADINKITALEGDYLLICSDGLSNLLEDEELLAIILEAEDLDAACEGFIKTAKARGGNDNITVVVIQISKGGDVDDR